MKLDKSKKKKKKKEEKKHVYLFPKQYGKRLEEADQIQGR